MQASAQALKVAILAVPESSAATLFGMYDLFASAGRDWPAITTGRPGPALIHSRIVAATADGFLTPNGAWIQPQEACADTAPPDLICIPDLLTMPGEPVRGRHPRELQWLRDCHARGATIATACTGVLLVAEAGLLDDCDVTTHWAFCDALAREYPRLRVHRDRSLVIGGEGQRVIMAGGGTSWLDLALLLVARFISTEEAMHLARLYLLDWHHAGQQPFAALTRPRHVQDAVIERCQVWAAEHYDTATPVAAMAALSGLTERAFTRRFARATGMSPLQYIHSLRLEEAKQMLERDTSPIEAIAMQIGYEDASFFNRLFRRKVGLTPAQYRRRFGALRHRLQAGGGR